MNFIVCTIKDIVAGQFGELRCFNNLESAKRWFRAFSQKNEFGRDLQLFTIARYDVISGKIEDDFSFIENGLGDSNEK